MSVLYNYRVERSTALDGEAFSKRKPAHIRTQKLENRGEPISADY